MISLILEKGGTPGTVFNLQDGEHLLGRSQKCSIRLTAEDVSREHLHLTVIGNQVTLENLSKYGTWLDGAKVQQGRVQIRNGQMLSIGKQTVLKVDLSPDLSFSPLAGGDMTIGGVVRRGDVVNEAASLAGGSMSATRPPLADEASRKSTAHGGRVQDDDPPSRGTRLQEPEEALSGGGTRAQMTRGVPAEVIEEARREILRREKRKVILWVSIPVLLLIAVAMTIHYVTPPPEATIAWPQDASGQRMKGYEPGLILGKKDGGYDVMYPLTADASATNENSVIKIKCSLGRKGDVPMRISVKEEILDEARVCRDGETAVQQWIAKASQSGAQLTFDKPLPKVLFLGESLRENGIPFRYIPFECTHDGQKWFGAAYVFRHGNRIVSTTVELPASERARTEGFLFNYYIEPAAEWVRSYWEGDGSEMPTSVEDSLTQIRQELRRQAPGTWSNIKRRLFGVLQKSAVLHDTRGEKEALELLALLRKQQALWFNNQAIQIVIARKDGLMDRVKQLSLEAQGVFTSPDDWRFYECRRW